MKINLYINTFKSENEERQNELDYCIEKNINNPYLNLIKIDAQDRPKFSELIKIVNSKTSNNDINIISNSDIYFDEIIAFALNIKSDEAYCLTRWNIQKDLSAIFYNQKDSFDSWIFRGKIEDKFLNNFDFYIGSIGCDNRMSCEFYKIGYKISNPSLKIKSYHYHLSNFRNYENIPRAVGDYALIKPSYEEAYEPEIYTHNPI